MALPTYCGAVWPRVSTSFDCTESYHMYHRLHVILLCVSKGVDTLGHTASRYVGGWILHKEDDQPCFPILILALILYKHLA